jgi:hypothetical protein
MTNDKEQFPFPCLTRTKSTIPSKTFLIRFLVTKNESHSWGMVEREKLDNIEKP